MTQPPGADNIEKGKSKMKKTLALLLALSLVFALSACGSEPAPSDAGADVSELEARIAELEAENAELREQLENASVPASMAPTPNPEAVDATIGTTYTIDGLVEFTVNYAELKKEVLPPNPASYYTYYSEEDGMTYLDVAVSVKNLRTTDRRADEFVSATAICGDGYEYNGFSIIEDDNGGTFTYVNITNVAPLETAVIHHLISIPNELADDESVGITLDLTMLDSYEYTFAVR